MVNGDQHELQFLGILGVCRETSKIILKWWKIFAQITLTLILPLCIIILALFKVSLHLSFKIANYGTNRDDAWNLWLVLFGFFFSVFVFSPLLTSAVIYTVACIYATKQITFKKIMSALPRAWKRVMVTFFWCFALLCVFIVVAVGLLIVWPVMVIQFSGGHALGIAVAVILLILHVVGFVNITMIWRLASVISVLEDAYGRKAMAESKGLIKGKIGLSVWCFLGVLVCFVLVQAAFGSLVVLHVIPVGVKIGVGLICLMLQSMLLLFDLVMQTVIYFVCKSYHHENIDSSCFSDHLEVCLGDVPLKAKMPSQLEQLHV